MKNGSLEQQSSSKQYSNSQISVQSSENKFLEIDSAENSKHSSINSSSLVQNFSNNELKIKENKAIAQELQLLAQVTDEMAKALKESNSSNEEFQKNFEILLKNKTQEIQLIEQLKKNLVHLENQQSEQMSVIKSLVNQSVHTQESSEEVQLSFLSQQQNILLIKQLKSMNRNQVMPVNQCIKLFEEFMNAKLKQDKIDFQQHQDNSKIRSMSSYFLQFLKEKYQDKQEGYEVLNSFLNCIQKLFKENHIYGTLICQLLQVYSSNTMDQIFSTFVTKLNQDFKTILEIFECKAKNSKKHNIKQFVN